jgi:hypothetical protein
MTTQLHQTESTGARERQVESEAVSQESASEVLRRILDAPLSPKNPPGSRIITGHLQGIDDEGRVLFVAEQGDGAPVPVAIGAAISDGVLIPAARNHQRALVVCTDDSPSRWVLIGLVRERVASAARDAAPGELEVKLDGETLRLTADREIELRCGNASLILRQSGRVILKGTHVVTSSRGPLKVKGATVEIN